MFTMAFFSNIVLAVVALATLFSFTFAQHRDVITFPAIEVQGAGFLGVWDDWVVRSAGDAGDGGTIYDIVCTATTRCDEIFRATSGSSASYTVTMTAGPSTFAVSFEYTNKAATALATEQCSFSVPSSSPSPTPVAASCQLLVTIDDHMSYSTTDSAIVSIPGDSYNASIAMATMTVDDGSAMGPASPSMPRNTAESGAHSLVENEAMSAIVATVCIFASYYL